MGDAVRMYFRFGRPVGSPVGLGLRKPRPQLVPSTRGIVSLTWTVSPENEHIDGIVRDL